MKPHFLNYFCCPSCKGDLQFTSFQETTKQNNGEIAEGKLTCGCGAVYPVIGGVPRLLPAPFFHSLKIFYKDFFQKYGMHFPSAPQAANPSKDEHAALKIKQDVIKNFGYEWRTFSSYDLDNFRKLFHPEDASILKDKMVLDAGCGAGRHARSSAEAGAKVIGMDLSTAVDAAYENTKSNANICIAQADITHPPFKENSFDFIYSFGVLHHLPDPQEGFRALTPLLKKDGQMMFWVYSSKRKFSRTLIEALRKVTTKLPSTLLQSVSFACACFDYFVLIMPYKMVKHKKAIENFLKPYVPSRIVDYAQYDFRITYVDWFDRLAAPVSHYHSKDELEQWFRDAAFSPFAVTPTEDWGWRCFGTRSR